MRKIEVGKGRDCQKFYRCFKMLYWQNIANQANCRIYFSFKFHLLNFFNLMICTLKDKLFIHQNFQLQLSSFFNEILIYASIMKLFCSCHASTSYNVNSSTNFRTQLMWSFTSASWRKTYKTFTCFLNKFAGKL